MTEDGASVKSILDKFGIKWEHIRYEEEGGFLSRYNYLKELTTIAEKLHATHQFKLVHCRSYLAALIGLHFKRKFKVPFVFDMRGLWADERIDGKIWNKRNLLHFLAFSYFKKKEKEFFRECDALISLTQRGSSFIDTQFSNFHINEKTTVIPCCTDTGHFSGETKSVPNLGYSSSDHVLLYSGSIGTWYNTSEMIDCVGVWKKFIPNLKLLIITKDHSALQKILNERLEEEREMIKTVSVNYSEMPGYMKIAKASIFFIKPAHSKIASSPTKMAECWSMGLPIITNKGIGDNDHYIIKEKGGILIDDFTKESYESACKEYLNFHVNASELRKIALQYFDNKDAATKYVSVYQTVISKCSPQK